MPHLRPRYIQENIKKCMNFSGLVGLLGHRQVGKTTVLEQLCQQYYTLDKKGERDEAENNPGEYLKKRSGIWVGLDECQAVPVLFPELKEWVRLHKKPGQFLMSGSVRFTSRDAIRESLTGRIINLELLPFTVSELEEHPLPSFCSDAIELNLLESIKNWQLKSRSEIKKQHERMRQYFTHGGLPGVCFIRDEKLRYEKIKEQLNTLLDRDLRLVKKIQLSLTDLKAILSAIARQQGNSLDLTLIRNETGVSTPTIKKVIYALEAIFLIRPVPIEGSTKGLTYYLEDQAEHSHLTDDQFSELEKLNHFCFLNLRAQFQYRLGEATQIFQYRTRGGALIPLAFKNRKGVLGVLPIIEPDQVRNALGSVNSFLKTYPQSKVLILHPQAGEIQSIQPRVLCLPVGQVI